MSEVFLQVFMFPSFFIRSNGTDGDTTVVALYRFDLRKVYLTQSVF